MLQDVLPLQGVQDRGPQTVLPLAELPRDRASERSAEPIEYSPAIGEDPAAPGVRRGADWRRLRDGGSAAARPWAEIDRAWGYQDVRVGRGKVYEQDRRMLEDLRAQTWDVEDLNRREEGIPIWLSSRELTDPVTGEQLALWESSAKIKPRAMLDLQRFVGWLWQNFCEGAGGIFEKQDQLAHKLCISVRTFQRRIRHAEERGLVYSLPLRVVDAETGRVLQRYHVYRLGPAITALAAVAAFEDRRVQAPQQQELKLQHRGEQLAIALRQAARDASFAAEGEAYRSREERRERYQVRLEEGVVKRRPRRARRKQTRRAAISRARRPARSVCGAGARSRGGSAGAGRPAGAPGSAGASASSGERSAARVDVLRGRDELEGAAGGTPAGRLPAPAEPLPEGGGGVVRQFVVVA